MKIYISADIEGVAGITAWEEARRTSPYYPYFAEQMTKEVVAACEGAIIAGATEIVIKDAHASGMNINPSMLPQNIKLIRGWSGHPYKMIQGIDESFDAVIFIGYHSYGGSDANPLAHTVSSSVIDYIKLNGKYLSEFLLHSYLAVYLGISVVFLSGDKGICEEAKKFDENIVTVVTSEGFGAASISIHPDKVVELIKNGVKCALEVNFNSRTKHNPGRGLNNDTKYVSKDRLNNNSIECVSEKNLIKNKIELPKEFVLEIGYKYHGDAYKNSFYPGAIQNSPKSILFETNDYFEIMRATSFLI